MSESIFLRMETGKMESFPLPPPWIILENGLFYNDVTQETTSQHPGERLRELILSRQLQNNKITDSSTAPIVENEGTFAAVISEQQAPHEESKNENDPNESTKKKLRYVDFHCAWKEVGQNGTRVSYGMLIRYFEDQSVEIRFDGLMGSWKLPQLMGPYGPIDRHDLFIGAKVVVFGRHLTVTSANASTCHEIDEEGKRLLRKQEWIRKKIESVGAVPCIKRPPPAVNNSYSRGSKASGSTNLRTLVRENAKLGEQLAELGMSHLIANSKGTFRDDDVFLWKTVEIENFHDSIYHE